MTNEPFKIKDESNDRKYFTIIPNYIVNHSTVYEQTIYLYMKRVAGESGTCWESPLNIAKKLGVDPKTVRKYQKKLVERGCLYTAEIKKKFIKKTREIKEYTYYHCTRKTMRVECSQKKVIRDDNLEIQIEKEIEKYTILPEFLEWALDGLNKKNDTEINDRTTIYETQHKAIAQAQKELDELTEKTFHFATYARKAFMMAKSPKGLELKKEILMGLGEVPIIKDKILAIEPHEWLQPIKNDYHPLKAEYLGLELDKKPLNKVKTEALASVRARWLFENIRTELAGLGGRNSPHTPLPPASP